MFSQFKSWLAKRGLRRQFRYPALAAANRVLLLLESEVTDFKALTPVMEEYKKAQGISEPTRDLAYIPIYFKLEEFLATHQPPVTKSTLTIAQIRDKVRAAIDIKDLKEQFRLIFLPENQQEDRLLKIGTLEFLRFLLTSLGQEQLTTFIKSSVGGTPLSTIKVTDDGISFEDVHQRMALHSSQEVIAAYRQLLQALFIEIKNVFGDQAAKELINTATHQIKQYYPDQMVSVFINALPAEARP